MIPAIKDLGKFIFERDYGEAAPVEEVLVEDIKGYDYILVILFEEANNSCKFSRVILKEYDSDDKIKYLYKSGSARGTDATPTSKITEVEKTLRTKILPCLKECAGIKNLTYSDTVNLAAQTMEKSLTQIISETSRVIAVNNVKTGIITIAVKRDGQELYLGDMDVFRKRIVDFCQEGYRFKHDTISQADNKICSVCGDRKAKIFGYAAPYSFYTVDKPGYISGGFDRSQAWKNHGICSECALYLDIGRNYIDNNMQPYPFYKRKYFIVPRLFNQDNKLTSRILKLYEKPTDDGVTLEKEALNEEYILRTLGSLTDTNNVVFNIVFYHPENSAFKLDLVIEDVLPSRLKKIYNTLSTVNRAEFFKSFTLRNEASSAGRKEEEITINHGFLGAMFNMKEYNRYFFEAIDKIIRGNKISEDFIIKHSMRVIREAYHNDIKNRGEWGFISLMTLLRAYGFLFYIKLLYMEGWNMETTLNLKNTYRISDYEGSAAKLYSAFLDDHMDFYDTSLKRAVFLTGVLAKKVLNIQRSKYDGRQSLWKKFKDLRMKKEDIFNVFTECSRLLENYNCGHYYSELKKLTGMYISNSGLNGERLSMDEISLIFTLGLNLEQCFIDTLKKEGEDNHER